MWTPLVSDLMPRTVHARAAVSGAAACAVGQRTSPVWPAARIANESEYRQTWQVIRGSDRAALLRVTLRPDLQRLCLFHSRT